MSLPNGFLEVLSYDRAGRLIKVVNKKGTSVLSSYAYTLDPVGNPTKVVTPSETVTYAYDARGRLTKACYGTGCATFISYAYDAVGNRVSEGRPAGTTTYEYDAADQLVSESGPGGTAAYGYGANGNLAAAGPSSFSHDLAGRLASATVGGAIVRYTYDGDGNLLRATTDPGAVTDYLWDPNAALPQLALERDGGGTVLRRYAHGIGPLSVATGGSPDYYLFDGLGHATRTTAAGFAPQPPGLPLGSVVNVTSSSGTPEWAYAYEPFGAARAETRLDPAAPGNPLRFAAQLLDPATGRYDLRARTYDPEVGRFLEPDA